MPWVYSGWLRDVPNSVTFDAKFGIEKLNLPVILIWSAALKIIIAVVLSRF